MVTEMYSHVLGIYCDCVFVKGAAAESGVVHRIFDPKPNQSLPDVSLLHTVFSSQRRRRDQHMVWDDETIRHLRDLWAQGLSTAEIGRRLGVSKNAIVGKAHRLDLDARPSPIRRDGTKPSTERPSAYPRMAGPTLPPLASAGGPAAAPPSITTPAPWVMSTHTQDCAPSDVVKPELRFHENVQLRSAPVVDPRPVAALHVAAPAPRAVTPIIPIQVRRTAPSCCWPIGEPGTKLFRFCDDMSMPGKPYCDEHAKLAYVKIRDRKENAA